MSELQLLSKFTVGGQELENRVCLSPMTRARCTPTDDPFDIVSTIPNDLMVTYYSQRASGGLLITEATAISEEGGGWRNAAHVHKPEHVEGWKKVVDAVHDKGSVIYCQLWHMGRQCHSSHHPSTNRTVSASDVPMPNQKVRTVNGDDVEGEVPHALTIDEIKTTVADYVHAAKMAKEAGFDGVELHSANGYLIDQFLQTCTNTRSDEYGGSRENRVKFLRDVFEGIRDSGAFPANRIGFKLSPNGAFGDMGTETNDVDFIYFAQVINEYNPAYVHVMDGLGFGFHQKCRALTLADFRKVFDGPIMSNVGLRRDTAEGIVRSGAADLFAFGRIYISNPDLVNRFRYDWPIEPEAPHDTWYRSGARGYTDWPSYKEKNPSAAEKISAAQ